MRLPVIVLGGGGHAKVLIDTLLDQSFKIIGFTDPLGSDEFCTLLGVPWLGNDSALRRFPPGEVSLVNGIGSTGKMNFRKDIYDKFKKQGYFFSPVIHRSAVIGSDTKVSEGVQIMAGAIVQPGSFVGQNTIINTRASVDHDCLLGSHVHIAPGVTLSGGVQIGDETHIGSGSTIIQGVNIGNRVSIGAGSLVVKDIPDYIKAYGVPAREVKA